MLPDTGKEHSYSSKQILALLVLFFCHHLSPFISICRIMPRTVSPNLFVISSSVMNLLFRRYRKITMPTEMTKPSIPASTVFLALLGETGTVSALAFDIISTLPAFTVWIIISGACSTISAAIARAPLGICILYGDFHYLCGIHRFNAHSFY